MNYLGDFVGDETVPIFFDSFDAAGASASITGLAVTDIEIYKAGSVTQRSSDSGYALLDTDGIDFDSLVGINGFSIELGNNADVGFFSVGNDYVVIVSTITLEGEAVSFIAASFSIQNRFMRGTDSGATAAALATVDTVVDGIQTDLSNATDGLGALKALIDTVNADLSNGTDGLSALKALIDTVDTVADAIKVVTDKFVFTKANEVDGNTKSINDAEVVGDGNTTPWDGV